MLKVRIWTNKAGNVSRALVLDFGYRKQILSWENALMAECLAIPVVELFNLPAGDYEIKF